MTMLSFHALLLAAITAMRAAAHPVDEAAIVPTILEKREGLATGQGTSNGWFYSWWADTTGSHVYNNGAGGSYDITWSGSGNFVGGKGYKTGSARYDPSQALLPAYVS